VPRRPARAPPPFPGPIRLWRGVANRSILEAECGTRSPDQLRSCRICTFFPIRGPFTGPSHAMDGKSRIRPTPNRIVRHTTQRKGFATFRDFFQPGLTITNFFLRPLIDPIVAVSPPWVRNALPAAASRPICLLFPPVRWSKKPAIGGAPLFSETVRQRLPLVRGCRPSQKRQTGPEPPCRHRERPRWGFTAL